MPSVTHMERVTLFRAIINASYLLEGYKVMGYQSSQIYVGLLPTISWTSQRNPHKAGRGYYLTMLCSFVVLAI